MMGPMVGGAVSSGGRRLVQFATVATVAGGLGLAGLGAYGVTGQGGEALAWAREHSTLLMAIGIGAIVFGWMLNWWASRQMMKQVQSSMQNMMGAGGFPAPTTPPPSIRVRCRACGNLEAEAAQFCSKCGASMK